MPIYEYGCGACGKEFEILAKDGETPTCPHCGSGETTRLMSCCARSRRGESGDSWMPASGGGGCGGCSGGNCASCGR